MTPSLHSLAEHDTVPALTTDQRFALLLELCNDAEQEIRSGDFREGFVFRAFAALVAEIQTAHERIEALERTRALPIPKLAERGLVVVRKAESLPVVGTIGGR